MILDELVAVTGWSRANARRSLSTARKRKGPAKAVVRKPRGRTYGYGTLKVLIEVWRFAGMPSGKYLAATMALWLPKLEALRGTGQGQAYPGGEGAAAEGLRCHHRPAAQTDQGRRQAQGHVRDPGRAPAAQLEDGPQGRG